MHRIKKDIFDIIESYYLAHLLIFLSEEKFFADPAKRKAMSFDAKYETIFETLSQKTDFFQNSRAKYALKKQYETFLSLDFYIRKFLLSYGIFANRNSYPYIIKDERYFSEVYKKVSGYQNWNFLIDILGQLNAKKILDLGCGTGSLAIQFCKKKTDRSAIGIEKNKGLYEAAKTIIKKEKLTTQFKIFNNDAFRFTNSLKKEEIKELDVIVGANIFNEFFLSKGKSFLLLIKKLKRSFPSKYLVILDYYSVLGTRSGEKPEMRRTYVHDMMQLFSGQGVPPQNFNGWNTFYKNVACEVIHVFEGEKNGVRWFIHILRL